MIKWLSTRKRVVVAGVTVLLLSGYTFADELEDRLREAREQLDAAAERLAELHRQMYEVEMSEGRYGKRAMLGILLTSMGDDDGLVIAGVTPDGGAKQAGLAAGDRIVAIGGVRLDTGGADKPGKRLSNVVKELEPGDPVEVEYVRDGETVTTEVVTQPKRAFVMKSLAMELDQLDPEFTAELAKEFEDLGELKELKELGKLEALHQLGDLGELIGDMVTVGAPIKLEDMDGDLAGYFGVDEGVLVVAPPSEDSELKSGDVLLELDGRDVTDARDAMKTLAMSDETIDARVLRNGKQRKVSVDCSELTGRHQVAISHGPRVIRIQRGMDGDDDVEVKIVVDEEVIVEGKGADDDAAEAKAGG
ncbi:MAG: PDZ domain-containing protein [Pseudomonadales bacterium]|nr:PDZ domain-containing protein [Pseudomonadales bacterium]NIX06692.1 PDZ domain-containing protein [Pseudomonadales bacterium]